MSKVAIVVPSIRVLNNIPGLLKMVNKVHVIIVDEGDEKVRTENDKVLENIPHSFWGPEERADDLGPDVDVIPTRCHAETSFGFWKAHQLGAEVVVELDDDVWAEHDGDVVGEHLSNLGPKKGIDIGISKSGWYNPLWIMNHKTNIFPRGFPYDPETRVLGAIGTYSSEPCVLNMGLWSGQPDLDAATILSLGGLKGRAGEDREEKLLEKKTIVGKNIFFPICSMNTSFRTEIIPAFYQMYMNYEGLDRYCDIWSGLFIKKICDHLGKNVSLGQPVAEHRKTERSTFKDLRAEHEGMAINETLWKVVRDMQLEGKTYKDTYDWLIQCLYDDLGKFTDKLHYKMMAKQVEMMAKWSELYE
jgi:hypothetical protein